MNKKLSKKDLKVWKDFIEGKEKLYNKDNINKDTKFFDAVKASKKMDEAAEGYLKEAIAKTLESIKN